MLRCFKCNIGPLYFEDDFDDFDKVGIANYGAKNGTDTPLLMSIFARNDSVTQSTSFWLRVEFSNDIHTLAGAPEAAWIGLTVPWGQDDRGGATLRMTVQLVNKTTTRLPEAIFLRFSPKEKGKIGNSATQGLADEHSPGCSWTMQKLGSSLDPTRVVTGGGKWMHVVDAVTFNCSYSSSWNSPLYAPAGASSSHGLRINTYDSGLVRWGPLSALPVPTTEGPGKGEDGAFILFNNLWGTNYIMWYPFETKERDIKYEYDVYLWSS